MDQYRDKVIKWKNAVNKTGIFYVFDTETTGLSPEDCDIIEFSAVKAQITSTGADIVDELDIFINPGYPIPEEITNLTGITQDKIDMDGIQPMEAVAKIKAFWGGRPVIAGYNSITFDQPFMSALYRKTIGCLFVPENHLDICRMTKEKYPKKKHNLKNMAKFFGCDKGLHFHSSIDDVKATVGVLLNILPEYQVKEPDDEPILDIKDFYITWVSHFKKSYKMNRIYVKNTADAKVYYDVPNRMWYIGGHLPEDDVLAKIYKHENVNSDAELVEKYVKEA